MLRLVGVVLLLAAVGHAHMPTLHEYCTSYLANWTAAHPTAHAPTHEPPSCECCKVLEREVAHLQSHQHYVHPTNEEILENCEMGMRNHRIHDDHIHASSDWDDGSHHHSNARLDAQKTPTSMGAWSAAHNQQGEWLEVEFTHPRHLSGIVTQGRPHVDQWVTTYEVACASNSSRHFEFILEDGHPKIFHGNVDSDTHNGHQFPHVVLCLYIRVFPLTWHNHISMRVEFLDGQCFGEMEGLILEHEEEMQFCQMGMKDGHIHDEAISSSSDWDNSSHNHTHARLDEHASQTSAGAWSAEHNQVGEWLDIDFGHPTPVAGIITQGRHNFDQWVTSYMVGCGPSVDHLEIITEATHKKVFHGNTDSNTHVAHRFPTIIACRHIRIYPQTWHNHISMRVEFLHGKCYVIF